MSSVTTSHFHINTQETNCSYCSKKLSEQPDRLVRAKCEHVFHNACFNQWRMAPNRCDPSLQRPCNICVLPLEDAQYIQCVDKEGSRYVVIPSAVPGVRNSEYTLEEFLLETERSWSFTNRVELVAGMCWTALGVGYLFLHVYS
jgi:hypothetical protein